MRLATIRTATGTRAVRIDGPVGAVAVGAVADGAVAVELALPDVGALLRRPD